MRDVLYRLELLAAWLKPGGAYPDEPIPDKYSTLVEAIGEIERLRIQIVNWRIANQDLAGKLIEAEQKDVAEIERLRKQIAAARLIDGYEKVLAFLEECSQEDAK